LHLSSNFAFAGFGEKRQYDYTRSGNPTRDALAEALSSLEGGAGAVVTSSGMAALTLLCQLLEPGDALVAPHDCYGGTYRLFENLAAKGHFEVIFVDQTRPAALRTACERKPKLILTETPSNPLLRIVDIAEIAKLAKQCGALLAVDNTFLSPALQQPLSLGADLVIHSTTKYLNGHSDVVGGSIVAATDELAETLAWWGNCLGITGAPTSWPMSSMNTLAWTPSTTRACGLIRGTISPQDSKVASVAWLASISGVVRLLLRRSSTACSISHLPNR
jgi:cystathionine gamma-synthase